MDHTPSPPGRWGDTGASLPQYVLLLTLVVGLALVALGEIGAAGNDSFQTAAGSLSEEAGAATPPPLPPPTPTSTGGQPPSHPPTTTTPTTTTAPPTTTTAPPTTTTAPPTTTTAPTTSVPPTTAPAPAGPGDATWRSATTDGNGGRWTASAALTATNDRGDPVASARVEVTVRAYTREGGRWSWQAETVTLTTGADGSVTLSRDFKGSSGNGQVSRVEYVLTAVEPAGSEPWPATDTAISFDRP